MTPKQIEAIETRTISAPTQVLSEPPGKAEYLRHSNQVIGWDRGEDATLSFVECSGGTTAGRSYHGRPITPDNVKLKGVSVG